MTHYGYIKRTILKPTKAKRGGRGIIGLSTREEDFVEDLYITSTHNHMLFLLIWGKCIN